ncbi:MAG: hypothetical protein QS99_C0002G0096 [archaeon GW2011_AR4]|nr:MAG: hypothetical protein QS99_C0002G0096 [archaeon GW2011_AR4]
MIDAAETISTNKIFVFSMNMPHNPRMMYTAGSHLSWRLAFFISLLMILLNEGYSSIYHTKTRIGDWGRRRYCKRRAISQLSPNTETNTPGNLFSGFIRKEAERIFLCSVMTAWRINMRKRGVTVNKNTKKNGKRVKENAIEGMIALNATNNFTSPALHHLRSHNATEKMTAEKRFIIYLERSSLPKNTYSSTPITIKEYVALFLIFPNRISEKEERMPRIMMHPKKMYSFTRAASEISRDILHCFSSPAIRAGRPLFLLSTQEGQGRCLSFPIPAGYQFLAG